nr:uncharacterized protein LOC111769351 [Equus caballus]
MGHGGARSLGRGEEPGRRGPSSPLLLLRPQGQWLVPWAGCPRAAGRAELGRGRVHGGSPHPPSPRAHTVRPPHGHVRGPRGLRVRLPLGPAPPGRLWKRVPQAEELRTRLCTPGARATLLPALHWLPHLPTVRSQARTASILRGRIQSWRRPPPPGTELPGEGFPLSAFALRHPCASDLDADRTPGGAQRRHCGRRDTRCPLFERQCPYVALEGGAA